MTSTSLADDGSSITGIKIEDAQTETYKNDDAYTQTVTIAYIGDGPPPTGYSIGIFEGKNFEVSSIAEVADTGSKSDQTQGLNYPAPKS
jgi:hypothetical protein